VLIRTEGRKVNQILSRGWRRVMALQGLLTMLDLL